MSSYSSFDRTILPNERHSYIDKASILMFIGETGAGKSTIINYLYNYFHNGNLNNLKTIIPSKYHQTTTESYTHNELFINDNTQSKTNSCTQYRFTDRQTQKQYIFLDTPGLSDTRGKEQSHMNIHKILEAATQLGHLTCIVIVVNGSVGRLTSSLRYTIECLNGNLPDRILEHATVILTNCTKTKSTFDLKVLNLHGDVYPFYMQNDAFVSDPTTWTNSTLIELEKDWDHSMNQIKLMLKVIDSFQQMSIDAFAQMKHTRNEMKLIIHQVRVEIMQILKIQSQFAELELESRQAKRDLVEYTDRTNHNFIEKIEIVDVSYHSTLCANCSQVCHANCHLNETTTVGSQIFLQCSAMKDDRCQTCSNRCSYRYHYHAKKTIRRTRDSLRDAVMNLKAKYGQTQNNRTQLHGRHQTISETKELLERALSQNFDDLKTKSINLLSVCSSFYFGEDFRDLIDQLKVESNVLRNMNTKMKIDCIINGLKELTQRIEEKQAQKQQRRPPMHIIHENPAPELSAIDLEGLKTSQLIDLYKNPTDTNIIKVISNELYRRAHGKSLGPLFTSNDFMMMQEFSVRHQSKNLQDLVLLSRRIQQRIDAIIGNDIIKILNVDSELLIENFTVHLLINKAEQVETNPQELCIPKSTATSPTLNRNNSYPAIHYLENAESKPTNSLPYPRKESMPSPVYSPSTNKRVFGFSHLQDPSSTPYPIYDDPSILPPLPSDYSPKVQQNIHRSRSLFGFEPLHRQRTQSSSSALSLNNQELIPMPVPMSYLPTSVSVSDQGSLVNNLNSSNTTRLNHAIGYPSILPIAHHSSIPDVVPTNDDFNESSQGFFYSPSTDDDTHVNNQDLSTYDTSQLLLKYADSVCKSDNSQRCAILEELTRRCYGDDPALIQENKTLYEQKLKLYEKQQLQELIKLRDEINQKIRGHLPGDDVTLIENIPAELIIEANVLKKLILKKRSV